MNQQIDGKQITVQGQASIRKRPNYLLIIGSVLGKGNSLELALQNLEAKQKLVESWLLRIEAGDIEFGEPRLPEQVESDGMDVAKLHMKRLEKTRRLLGRAMGTEDPDTSQPGNRQANVTKTFMASWKLEGLSSSEVLILADRIRVEAGDESDEPEQTPPLDSDLPSSAMAAVELATSMTPDKFDDRETRFLFKTAMDSADKQQLVDIAIADARQSALTIADRAGLDITELESIRQHTHFVNTEQTMDFMRDRAFPILKEVHLDKKDAIYLENPRPAVFTLAMSVTFRVRSRD